MFGLGALTGRLRHITFHRPVAALANTPRSSRFTRGGKVKDINPQKRRPRANFLPRQTLKSRIIDTITDVCI
jgi:hypothetical protein